ncbi:zinc ribbon domain-containing protein [Candidatus Babeliales bacterium]|nr:zinc ribbon domain-containing protein [Candidatus Babeliales bacterium]
MPLKRCQSCGVPLVNDKVFGKEKDKSKNEVYCTFCYKEGVFTEPEITMEAMIEKCTAILTRQSKIPQEQANKIMNTIIPQLKRWQH